MTRQVSSMIHSARPTVSPVANIVFALFCFARFWKVGTDRRTVDMCKNNYHYRPWLWVGRVDQQYNISSFISRLRNILFHDWETFSVKEIVLHHPMKNKTNTEFVNGPLGQIYNSTGSDHYSHVTIILFFAILKSGDGRTTSCKK